MICIRILRERFVPTLVEASALAAAAAALSLAGSAPAGAQEPAPQQRECARIENDAERLACYDRALRDSPAPAPEPAAAAPTPPSPAAVTALSAERETVPSTEVVVVSLRQRPGLNTLFTTEQGEVWAQVGFEQSYFPPPPFAAQIKPGRLGSFFLVPEEGTAVRIRRRN